jgi:hypothetical protein
MTGRYKKINRTKIVTASMTGKILLHALMLAFLSLAMAGAGQAQEIPACQDEEVLRIATEAVIDAHAKSNFAGLGTGTKVATALRFMIEYEPIFEVQPKVNLLAEKAGYGPENIRACMTSEWTYNQRAVVFIMLSPDDPDDWGLFMFNVALDLPVATGWVAADPVE